MVFPSPMFYAEYRRLLELAAKHRLPAIYVFREAVEAGGRIKSYLHPHRSGGIKDRQVDKRLVDDFGAWSIDELSEGELAEYLAEDCNPS